MPPNQLDQISLAIGSLQADVKNLARDMSEDRQGASEDRREIRTKLEDMDDRLKTIEPVAAEVAAMKPYVDDYKTLRKQAAVAVALLSGAFYLAWQGLASVGPEIKGAILRLLTKS
jgi:hypothetical protein